MRGMTMSVSTMCTGCSSSRARAASPLSASRQRKAERFADRDAEAADGLLVIDDQQSDAKVVLREILRSGILRHHAALPMVCSTTVMKSCTRNGFSTQGAPVRRSVAAVSSLAMSPVIKTRRVASSGRCLAIQA
jgi:hypothetical protein